MTTQIVGTTRMAPATMLPAAVTPRPRPAPRQEYYADLRATVSREESAVARQTIAEERAAAEKWQETAAESRWMWSEYQRKWPPAERPAVDRSKAGGRRDEAFSQDLVWERTAMLVSAERGDLDNEFIEITEEEANQLVTRIKADVTGANGT
jgi:hypothetical protein